MYMLNLIQKNKLMTEFTTPDGYFFWGVHTSASQISHWWIITMHHDGSPLNLDGEKQSQKHSSLLGQAYYLTWCRNIYPKTINHNWAPSAT